MINELTQSYSEEESSMHELTEADIDRLLSRDDAMTLRRMAGNRLASLIAESPQPPEMGMVPEDDYKRSMIRHLQMYAGADLVSK